MCLTVTGPQRPYNRSFIRFKAAGSIKNRPYLHAWYQDSRYTIGTWMQAKGNPKDPSSFGFHVFPKPVGGYLEPYVFKSPYIKQGETNSKVVIVVRVRGFLQRGRWGNQPCETWREMKIINVLRTRKQVQAWLKKHRARKSKRQVR